MMRRALAFLVAALAIASSASSAWAQSSGAAALRTPAEHVRTPDQTYLTFPEWYLVHSPAEYADYLASNSRISAFPLFAHIGQFWQSYAAVNREIDKYPFNAGYHVMVMVIGVSTSVEYALKGVYEHTLGRLAEATRTATAVPEEQFAARYARAYVDFIRIDPWYLFDFWSRFTELWQTAPLEGPNLVRRWERRFALSTELLVKEGYARLIKLGAQSIYDAPKPVTVVVLSRAPEAEPGKHAEFRILQGGTGGAPVLATLPRYEAFTNYSAWLAAQGIDFLEIAGNNGDVLVSALASGTAPSPAGRVLFEQPILTQPGRRRVVFATPIKSLGAELRRAQQSKGQLSIEHVYDF
ncbi:MAG: hypothetical protein ABL900_14110 [Burkholderiaceae bacterium]